MAPARTMTKATNQCSTCEDDHSEKGGYAYKVGTKEKQHVVAVEPNGKSTLISLVYVESPKDDQKEKD